MSALMNLQQKNSREATVTAIATMWTFTAETFWRISKINLPKLHA